MTDIGELVVRIKADAAQLEREMGKARAVVSQSAGGMGNSLTGLKSQFAALVPALSVAAFVQFGKHAVDVAGHITDLEDRIGFASDTLSALETPLAASGASLDEFTGAINKMNNVLGEAAKGNEEAVKAFDQLGLSVNKLRTLNPEEQFYEIASAIGQIKDQSAQTEAGMNLFGRGFATLLPLLKQYDGDMRKAVEAQKLLESGLSKDTLDRVDAFGDSLSAAGIRVRNAFLEAFGAILRVTDAIGGDDLPANASYDRPQTVNAVTRDPAAIDKELRRRGLGSASAKGSNAELLGVKEREAAAKKLAEAKKTLDEYNLSLERQNKILQQTPREQAAMEAGYKTLDLAQKAGIENSEAMVEANKELARTNYDLAESMQEAARFQQILHDKLSSTLTDIAFRAGSAKEAMLGFAESIARAAFEKKVAGPFADALIGTGGSSGILDGAIGGVGKFFGGFYADGGRPPVGIPSIVGENGPELFVPNTAGAIIPNHSLGGSSVVISQSFNLNPGATEQTVAQLRNLVPAIKNETMSAVFSALQSGGPGSKIIGART